MEHSICLKPLSWIYTENLMLIIFPEKAQHQVPGHLPPSLQLHHGWPQKNCQVQITKRVALSLHKDYDFHICAGWVLNSGWFSKRFFFFSVAELQNAFQPFYWLQIASIGPENLEKGQKTSYDHIALMEKFSFQKAVCWDNIASTPYSPFVNGKEPTPYMQQS